MADVTMSLEEYEALRKMAMDHECMNCVNKPVQEKEKPDRKPSAYNMRYAKAFNKVEGKYKKKNGGWLKNGFKRAQREAHRIAGRGN